MAEQQGSLKAIVIQVGPCKVHAVLFVSAVEFEVFSKLELQAFISRLKGLQDQNVMVEDSSATE